MYLTIDALEQDVNHKIQQADFNSALNSIASFVGEIVEDPRATSLIFSSEQLDRLCLKVGKHAICKTDLDRLATDHRAPSNIVVTITSHLESYGGHTLVIENMIRAQPNMTHIVLITDLFDSIDIDNLVQRFEPIAEMKVAPNSESFEKLKWLAKQLNQICPEQIFLFNHHQDSIAIASIESWLDTKKVFFYHHADHNLCLGVHLPGATHIDPHNIGYFNCNSNLGVIDNYYLPLVIQDRDSRLEGRPFMGGGLLRSCSSGTWHKFKQSYSYNYIELICKRLTLVEGIHFHIGDIPDEAIGSIHIRLKKEGIEVDRFIHIPWVESLWAALIENNIDLYISSFPLGGGRATIEAMGSATPLLMHCNNLSRFNGGSDLAYPYSFEWGKPEEFFQCITMLTPSLLHDHSIKARTQYTKNHLPAIMETELSRIIKGNGSMPPPPLKEYKPNIIQRYLHGVGLDQNKILEQKRQLVDIKSQLNKQNMRVQAIENQLKSINKSFSWFITKPLRFTRRLAQGDFSQAKFLLKKTPIPRLIYPIRGRLRQLSSALSPLKSKQNTPALKNSSRYRSEVLFSPQHSPTDVDFEDLPLIDLSVVTYNNTNWLDNFIDSLIQQNYPINLINLIFVDNGSTDDSLQKLNNIRDRYTTEFNSIEVYSRPNKGFGAGHDFAIKVSNAKFVLVTNIDLEFEQKAIIQAVCIAVKDKKEVASWEFRQKPYEHPKHYDPISLDTLWSSHACILLRRTAYNEVGGYEPKIFMYGEDVELSYRFRKHGFRLRYIPYSVVYHFTYQEVGEIKPIQFSGSTLANMYIRLRYGTISDRLAGLFLQTALVIKGGGFKGSRRLAIKNFLAIIKNFSHFLPNQKIRSYSFPFRGFDYEMIRDGAFYHSKKMNTETPLVSIITRTYKGRDNWLKECVCSVINQTYNNIQHIIVEDGGNTMLPLVNKIQKIYGLPYQLLYKDLPKKGRSYAGNTALSMAKGKYVMFLDDDDLLYPDHVETLMSELVDSNYAAAYSLAWEVASDVEGNGEALKYTEYEYHLPNNYRQEFSREKLLTSNYIPIQSIIFKRELYEQLGGFDETMDYLEDWNLWTKYGCKYEFMYIPKTTSLYRVPYSPLEKANRKIFIDAAYKVAREKQKHLL